MEIEIQLVGTQIKIPAFPETASTIGARLEFSGVVRGEEEGKIIAALEYEAYRPMAEREVRRIILDLANHHECLFMRVIHRIGVVPVGELAIYVDIAAKHRAEALGLLNEFMNRLKQDVPIWKRRPLSFEELGKCTVK